MPRSTNIARNVPPSVPTEGDGRSRKMTLKAVNDNRAPLAYYFKIMMKFAAPICGLAFFAIAWWLS